MAKFSVVDDSFASFWEWWAFYCRSSGHLEAVVGKFEFLATCRHRPTCFCKSPPAKEVKMKIVALVKGGIARSWRTLKRVVRQTISTLPLLFSRYFCCDNCKFRWIWCWNQPLPYAQRHPLTINLGASDGKMLFLESRGTQIASEVIEFHRRLHSFARSTLWIMENYS